MKTHEPNSLFYRAVTISTNSNQKIVNAISINHEDSNLSTGLSWKQICDQVEKSQDRSTTVEEVVKKYNLRNISYTDLQKMTKELLDVGAIKQSEFLDFLPPSSEFAKVDGGQDENWNKPSDYIALIENQIAFMKENCPGDSIKYLSYELDLKKRFEKRSTD